MSDYDFLKRQIGICPVCGEIGTFVDVGPITWAVCHTHKKRWFFQHTQLLVFSPERRALISVPAAPPPPDAASIDDYERVAEPLP